MLQMIIRICLVVISWSSLLLLPKKVINKFLPVSIFTSALVLIVCALSLKYKFWVVKGKLATQVFHDLSFVFGPFFAGTIWIFHLTFGRFTRYILINVFMNAALAVPLSKVFEKLKVSKLKNFKSYHLFFTYMTYALIIYGYQYLVHRSKEGSKAEQSV
ncbi:hypothetical protein [Virgibacillus oceani]|uniref:Uncharacterized protein n=1 Tax=Virgibacillus oceani TaxID=1479511 RepID=A0A917HDJ3_9BACI|nr:hypothetical protein [Virgibacillus oceani]GGG75602.1 hypothetical protein GCM10011398_20570 [Virgibacillus oceani]